MARDDVVTPGGIAIPASAMTWRFSRGTGPGGQGVNTTDSRVELAVDLTAVVAPDAVAERVRAALGDVPRLGHDVTLVCQEPHPERFPWIDAWGHAAPAGVELEERRPPTGTAGRCTVLRPRIGSLLPVFVIDEYEGFPEVKRFVDCTDDELDVYLRSNVEALVAVAEWRRPDVVIAGHALPGPVVSRRALGDGFVAKIHGSDLEYAVREQRRCRDLAGEGLDGARAVAGASSDVLR